jgi:Tol biopolymer transport system component
MGSSSTAALAHLASLVIPFSCCLNAVLLLSAPFLKTNSKPMPGNVRRSASGSARKASTSVQAVSAIGKIAFASDRDGNFEIYLMDSDGGGQIRLTEDAGEDYSPAWSPDGTRLAFVSTRDGNAEIYLMNIDGTGQTRLTNTTASELAPVWTPNGSQIAFVTNRDGNDEIYLMNPDGSNQTNLTQHPADDTSLTYSLNGDMIAFSSDREDSQFEIYVMHANGAEAARLTTAEGDDITPVWSEQRISFQTNRDDNDEVYTMGFDGSNQTRLTNTPELDVDPGQTSEGARISLASSRDGNLEIYLMNPDGSGLQRLTSNNAADLQPALQPKGLIIPPPSQGASLVQFSATDYNTDEGQTSATLTVTRSNTSAAASVDFATINGTATNRTDYTYNSGTLTLAAGESTKTLTVLITDDAIIENDETLTVTLSNPSGASLGALNTATVTILNNDTARPSVNPIDNARFFVNQHYLDFLNRAPDQGGLDYWTSQITGCGNNISCLRSRRNGVSAAFFIESEFQLTGFFVYRLHKASFGTLPSRQHFIMDRSRVRAGPTLEADKLKLANDFVTRAAFLTRYPDDLPPEAFVNKLFDTAGLIPFTSDRQRLAQDMRNGKTRAQVLIEVIEIPQFKTNEFNSAFVLMQYFGYLGRDPEPAGFDFWLDVLNNREPNNFLGMVCSFITSTEYQERFSSVVTQHNSDCAVP